MRRAGMVGAMTLVAVLAVGCGDDGAKDADDGGTTAPGTSAAATPGAGTTSTDADAPAGLPRFCDLLTTDQVTEAVGAPVTLSTGPFDACEFAQEDLRALSGSLGAVEVQANGGYDAYRSGTKGALTDAVRHEYDGIGDAAYVDLGTVGGGENLQVGGGVLVGTVVYTVNLSQGVGLTEEELVAVGEKLLRLLVEAG